MGYPERLLSEGEVIETQFRPHWSGIFGEGLIILVGVALAVLNRWLDGSPWIFLLIAVAVVVLVAKGLVNWLTTNHVITNERLIYRTGFIGKKGTEIPLEVIQNVAFNQTIIERLLGTGDITVESAGTHGQTRYSDIPQPEHVQSLIYRMREARQLEVAGASPTPPSDDSSRVATLERLARLHDEGKITDEEYAAEKSRLLGES